MKNLITKKTSTNFENELQINVNDKKMKAVENQYNELPQKYKTTLIRVNSELRKNITMIKNNLQSTNTNYEELPKYTNFNLREWGTFLSTATN